jgi:eukaryotic-like serine/threonine-protein kinase
MQATTLEAGSELDGFRILRRLHAGGMAVIYEVTRDDLPGPAVMKVPRLEQGESGATVVSFEVEQMMLAAAGGGPVPALYAQGDLAREPYLVMERIEGETLSARMEQLPWPVDEVCRVGAIVADAIQALYERDIIHLDIKPSNIILSLDGRAVLIDLGLAHHAHLPDLLAEEFRRPLGSAPYISPEQIFGVRNDARSDIFALGAMLYQLATGHLPFGAPNSLSGLQKRFRMQAIPPRGWNHDLHPGVQEIILRCLEVDPARRYANAAQLAQALRDPDSVPLSARSYRRHRDSAWQRFKRWLFGVGFDPGAVPPAPLAGTDPIVLVLVSAWQSDEALQQALRQQAARTARARPRTRMAFVTVVKPAPVMGVADDAQSAPRRHLRLLVELRHWAANVDIEAARKTCHVIEGADVGRAVLDYIRANPVETVLLAAGPNEAFAGRATAAVARIALQAPCTVQVVRVPPGS